MRIVDPFVVSGRLRGRLDARRAVVFSESARSRTRVGGEHARRDPRPVGSRRMGCTVCGRRRAVDPREARCERPHAPKADHETDLDHGSIGGTQQGRCALEPPCEQVLVRRLTERLAELATEVRRGKVGSASQLRHAEGLRVPGIDQISCAEEVSGVRMRHHPCEYAAAPPPGKTLRNAKRSAHLPDRRLHWAACKTSSSSRTQ